MMNGKKIHRSSFIITKIAVNSFSFAFRSSLGRRFWDACFFVSSMVENAGEYFTQRNITKHEHTLQIQTSPEKNRWPLKSSHHWRR